MMEARMDEVEKLLKQLLAQGQPPATAAATPVVPVPTVEFLKRIQDLETDNLKAKMAEQLAEVRALVEKQDQVAAAQQASYERCKRTLVEGRLEDEETMRKQRTEISELKRRLQQQQQEPVFAVATQIVLETPPQAETSEATEQPAATRWNPHMYHSPSQKDKTAEQQEQVVEVLRSLDKTPKKSRKGERNKKNRGRQRAFADRVRRVGAATAGAQVATVDSDSEEDSWMPADPAVSLGGGEALAGPASGKRLSDREPGLGGTPESKESRF